MKKLLFAGLMATTTLLNAQSQYSRDSIKTDNFAIEVVSDGALENWRFVDSSQAIMFNQNLWIGGESNGMLYQSAQTYRQSKVEFYPGPISTDTNAYSRYNKVWKVSSEQIDSLRLGQYDTIPDIFLEWPAHGDTSYGEPLYLAPYVDANKDGYYDPNLGDYPSIRGEEAIFFIFNDVNDTLNPNHMGIEIHGMLYRLAGGGILDSMFFVDYRIINRSDSTYTNTWLSSWGDMDVGNISDDLTGTDIPSNAVITYNGDPHDESSGGFYQSFDHSLASAAMFLRQGPVADYLNGIDDNRDGCIDGVRDQNGICQPEDSTAGIREHMLMTASNFYNISGQVFSNPSNEQEERNLMMGLCKDGSNLIINGNYSIWNDSIPSSACGSTGGGIPFVFPGASYDSTGTISPSSPLDWYESPKDNADKRVMLSTGPFTLEAGESITLRTGFLWHRADSSTSAQNGGYYELLNKLRGGGMAADSADTSGTGSGVVKIKEPVLEADFEVYYQASSGDWFVENEGEPLKLELISLQGQKLQTYWVEAGSRKRIDLSGFSQGVYLLTDPKTGTTYKLLR